jgi:hypothetical protein
MRRTRMIILLKPNIARDPRVWTDVAFAVAAAVRVLVPLRTFAGRVLAFAVLAGEGGAWDDVISFCSCFGEDRRLWLCGWGC